MVNKLGIYRFMGYGFLRNVIEDMQLYKDKWRCVLMKMTPSM